MQLPSVERSSNSRPAGADLAAPAAARVIPVAPVNPSQEVQAATGVVNGINPDVQATASQSSTSDPLQGGSSADNTSKGWTERKATVQKPEEPPQEPISKMLLDHIHSLWTASAKAVEVWFMQNQEQVQNATRSQQLAENRNQDPSAIPGVAAKEALTYAPNKIKKPENI
jgi:hypothetical protein